MTAREMKIKTFSLIEEYYPEQSGLAEDEDVLNKINGVINSIQMELMPIRKISTYKDIEISASDDKEINIKNIIDDLYQIDKIDLDENYELIGDKYLRLPEDYEGTFRIYYYKIPELMDLTFESETARDNYDNSYEFELDDVLLEVMPYGIAADLLKMDMISGYGRYFYERYREMKQAIDSRSTKGIITITGGTNI